ncbi:MAG TPA: UDP-3-O-(3-hydroxymyristoyl)glucosamine N-acyltransferase [Chitinivibrionales bacterium]|nr:UDP-3-O-(3-hydroxymyristoyl)glucosamine N-acyltransferase [Chitinivibrionales bacterium]
MELERIAQLLGCGLDGRHRGIVIERIADPQDADGRSITFVSSPKYLPFAEQSQAKVVIVAKGKPVAGKVCLEVDDPYAGFAKVAQLFEDRSPLFDGPKHPTALIHPTAIVHETAFVGPYSVVGKKCRIGKGTVIGAHCVIENGAAVGEDCRIDSGAVVRRNCKIGNRVIIQSCAVIGSEGFGNAREAGTWIRIPSFGAVVIEDGAEIGACTTIDRGTLGDTVIGAGVKLDNLIQVAHNVAIGEHTAIAAQAGISGSTKIGRRVIVGGQAGFAGHNEIGDDAFVNAQSGVAKDVAAGAKVSGSPSRDFMTLRRLEAATMRLPEALKEIKQLRKELDEIKNSRRGTEDTEKK